MHKVGYVGYESSGKSYMLASISADILYRNARWRDKYGLQVRPILSTLPYSAWFVDEAYRLGVPIEYWSSLDDIKDRSECDIICDEIGKFFDSRFWEKLSLDIRTWVAEGAKRGVHWYFSAQDFSQVDVSFRRLVEPGDLFQVTKLIGSRRPSKTTPQVKFIWGILMITSINPRAYNEGNKKFESMGVFPSFRFIRHDICSVFKTNERVKVDNKIVMRHIDSVCSDPNCDYHKVMHV